MTTSPSPQAIARALSAGDRSLARLIAHVGPPAITVTETRSVFEALARAIVYQQLHGKAASTIFGRVQEVLGGARFKPEDVLRAEPARLRSAGLSRNKLAALLDLAEKAEAGIVPTLAKLRKMDDEAIVERLTAVRGIGRWTVEMLLIFRLGRPDVLPVSDFGVRHGFMLTYRRKEMPTPRELGEHGERWRPYRSAASWYMWRAVDRAREAKSGALST